MIETNLPEAIDDASPDESADSLWQTGALTDEQARIVTEHQSRTGLGFDEAAKALDLVTDEDIELAQQTIRGSAALQLAPAAAVSEEIVVLSDPASPQAEALRLLRTQIISQHVGAGRRAFAVTGATEGAGASYVAANLAVALAQVGIKTLLVDANLRSPRLDRMFGIDPNGPGLSTYLSLGVNRPERVIYGNILPSLSLIPAGPPAPQPQELLSGVRFRVGVDILLRQFDVAVFDTPATNVNADALTVAGVLGYALIAARRNHAFIKDVQVLSSQLTAARATVIAAVLNDYL